MAGLNVMILMDEAGNKYTYKLMSVEKATPEVVKAVAEAPKAPVKKATKKTVKEMSSDEEKSDGEGSSGNDSQKKKKSERKAPKEHAKDYDIGTEKAGLNGEMFVVTENKNGVKRWAPVK